MNSGFLLWGQEEKVFSRESDLQFRSMAEDCGGSNVRLKDRNVGDSEFPDDIRLWGRIRLASQIQNNTVVESRGRRLVSAYFDTSHTLASSAPDWTTLDMNYTTFDRATQESEHFWSSVSRHTHRPYPI